MNWIGIDAHKSSATIAVMDDNGNVIEMYKVNNDLQAWTTFYLKYSGNATVAIESSTAGKHIARLLRDFGMDIHIANPNKLNLIFKSTKKTDMEDAVNLAKLLRLNELPESYLPSKEIDEIRSLVRYRRSLGKEIVIIKNKIHSMLTLHGIKIKETDIFGKRGLEKILEFSGTINEVERSILNDLLSRLKDIEERIEKIENMMAKIGNEIDDVKLLMSFPGVDVYSALSIYSDVGDISRFPDKDHFASYAGLVPRVDQSGEREIHGKITKKGPSILRFFIVNSTHTLIKLSPTFKKMYMKLVRRLGKNKAIIAVARKFATMIYIVLKTKTQYMEGFEALYNRKLRKMKRNAELADFPNDYFSTENLINGIDINHLSKEPFS